ncbi:MAG TPA: DUF2283 domain-containing protein [Chloroflexota bacterium]|nr:DUF2283 domain-containing protein [Chloroflexota bacterium]
MTQSLKYDADADAIYIRLNDLPYGFGEDIDHERRIDYAESGEPVGIEILCASTGVDTRGLPDEDAVRRLAEGNAFRVFA